MFCVPFGINTFEESIKRASLKISIFLMTSTVLQRLSGLLNLHAGLPALITMPVGTSIIFISNMVSQEMHSTNDAKYSRSKIIEKSIFCALLYLAIEKNGLKTPMS